MANTALALDDDREWISTLEASEILGVTIRALYRMIDDDVLPAVRVGRVFRVARRDVVRIAVRGA